MKVKVSHEVPLQLLGLSETFNDYDYCLPHLLDKYPEYEAYFRQAKEKGRYIMNIKLILIGLLVAVSVLLTWRYIHTIEENKRLTN